MDIGKRLKIARDAIGFTLEKAELESGIGKSSINEFENSKREPKFSQLNKLAEAYKRSVHFFLSDEPIRECLMLWRDSPETEERKKIETELLQLCEQYHRLELCNNAKSFKPLPAVEDADKESFDFRDAEHLADDVHRALGLGDIPSMSLKQILEENYYVKIFHLDFKGSAVSLKDAKFGYAVLLNKKSKLWRRNFDLAHELFHLLTWDIFRKPADSSYKPSDDEEKFANVFASRLLLPTNSVKYRIDSKINNKGSVSFADFDEIAREFCVSLDALLWRLNSLYGTSRDTILQHVNKAKSFRDQLPERKSDIPDCLPERYWSLGIRALREGNISLLQFAKYMQISYKKAEEYLMEGEEITDEEISISIA